MRKYTIHEVELSCERSNMLLLVKSIIEWNDTNKQVYLSTLNSMKWKKYNSTL